MLLYEIPTITTAFRNTKKNERYFKKEKQMFHSKRLSFCGLSATTTRKMGEKF